MEDLISLDWEVYPPRARGNCRIYFRWKGKPVFVSAHTKKEKEAGKAAPSIIKAWIEAKREIVAPAPSLPVLTMKAAVDRYLALEHENSKEGTVTEAKRNLKKLGDALGWPNAPDISKTLYREKYPELRDAVASHTWANELGEHRRFARFLVREEILLRDFTEGVKRPKRSTFGTREVIYQEGWFQPLWDELEHEWREAWEDHWFTGMDTKDLWEFDPQKHLSPVKDDWKIWKRRAKESEMIDQPLPSKIKARWIAAKKSGQTRLHASAGRYVTPKSWGNQIRKALHAAQRKLGLPLLDLKTTRHTFATRHLLRSIRGEKNAPSVEEIQRWLGHAKGSTEIHRTYLKLLSNPHMMD
jgi:integrase